MGCTHMAISALRAQWKGAGVGLTIQYRDFHLIWFFA